jgi:predicted glycosyltransferase
MRLLFDIAHPAHVHLFRHLIGRVQREGGAALMATRDKDVAVSLCESYRIPQRVLSRAHAGSLASLVELLRRTASLLRVAREFRPDALLGPSVSVGPVARLIGRSSFVFCEDDADVVPRFARLAYPLAHWIVTPGCLARENHGRKHLTYPGYHELAYLHPNHFAPDEMVCRSIGLDPAQPFFVLRLVALTGHHDTTAAGLAPDMARRILQELEPHGRVLISAEEALPGDLERLRFPLPPERLHHLMAFASLLVADSQTMAAEAAVLGVPNIRCSSFVGRLSYLEELEHRFGLTRGVPADRPHDVLALLREWLPELDALKRAAQERRKRMLDALVDVSEWQWRTLREKLAPPAAQRSSAA